jgi:hypothetical protein
LSASTCVNASRTHPLCTFLLGLHVAFPLLLAQVSFNVVTPVRGFAAASDDKALNAVGKVEGDTTAAAGAAAPDVVAGDADAARDLTRKGGGEPTSTEAKASSTADNAGDRVDGQRRARGWRNFSKPTISLLSIAATLTSVVVASWLTGIVGPDRATAAEKERKQQQAAVAASFRDRRVKAVKESLKSTMVRQQRRSGKGADGGGKQTLPLLDRPYAYSVVAPIVETAGLYMLCGPKGDGKSSLVWQLAERNPFVILVDLQNGGIDQAVRAVAAAIGYSLTTRPTSWPQRQQASMCPPSLRSSAWPILRSCCWCSSRPATSCGQRARCARRSTRAQPSNCASTCLYSLSSA